MEWNIQNIIVTLIFSAVGFVYASYGKRQAEVRLMICGIALMSYSYFVDSIGWNIAIGVILSGLPFVWR